MQHEYDEERLINRQRIGAMLAQARTDNGLTVRQLADLCGVCYQNITKIENGRYNVSIDILNKVCRALQLEMTLKKR